MIKYPLPVEVVLVLSIKMGPKCTHIALEDRNPHAYCCDSERCCMLCEEAMNPPPEHPRHGEGSGYATCKKRMYNGHNARENVCGVDESGYSGCRKAIEICQFVRNLWGKGNLKYREPVLEDNGRRKSTI